MKTVLIYVIACNIPPYPQLTEASLSTWDSISIEGVQTWYYCGQPRRPIKPCVLEFPVPEGYFNMGRKNILAYKWALDRLQWDYMARVNASCYVRKKQLHDYVQTIPESGVFEGLKAPKGDGTYYLWGGGQYIISRDVVQKIYDNRNLWDHAGMEDVSMSKLVADLGIEFRSGKACSVNQQNDHWLCITYGDNRTPPFEFDQLCEMSKAPEQYFIRVKQDLERHLDIEIMRDLHHCGI